MSNINTPATAVLDLPGGYRLKFEIDQTGRLIASVKSPDTATGWNVNPVAAAEFAEQANEVAHASMAHPDYRGAYPVRHKPGWIHLGSNDDGALTGDGELRCGTWAADPARKPYRCRLEASHASRGWAHDFELADIPVDATYIREEFQQAERATQFSTDCRTTASDPTKED